MPEITVTKKRLFAGVWEGTLSSASDAPPDIEVRHQNTVVGFDLTQAEGAGPTWNLRIPIPVALLSDGIQVFVIADKTSGDRLEAFTVVTGEPLDDDIRAETELLRAELDMLKRAFRRHCLETDQQGG